MGAARGQAVVKTLELQHKLRRVPIDIPPPLLTECPELNRLGLPAGGLEL